MKNRLGARHREADPLDDLTHDAEMDAIVAMLEDAGLIEAYTNEDGTAVLRLTARGAQVGRAMAMGGEESVVGALMDASQS